MDLDAIYQAAAIAAQAASHITKSQTTGNECSQNAICLELAKGFPAALVTLTIGIAGALIAVRQYYTARAKLKLDLFDKRYTIFMYTWTHLSYIVERGAEIKANDSERFKTFKNFRNNVPQAEFLFGPKIGQYLECIHTQQMALWEIVLKLDTGTATQEDIERETELMLWFVDAAKTSKEKFKPYLSFEKWV